MAVFTRHFSLFFLLTLLSSFQIHARDTQYFFNKIPGNNNNYAVNPEQEEQKFIPENENNGYGLQGQQESAQFPPSTTTTNNMPYKTEDNNMPYKTEEVPNKRYLPRNYNSVSYVTVPEDNTENEDSKFTTTENNHYYGAGAGNGNYYNSHRQSSMPTDTFMESGYTTTPTTRNNHYNSRTNNYYGGAGQEESYPTTTTSAAYNHYNAQGNKVQQMGMSDTRFLENGKYYYDTNTERYARHPLENAGINLEEFKKQFGNSNNNFVDSNNYQNDEQFQDEDDLP